MPSKAVCDAFEARLELWPNITACPFVDANGVSDVPKPPYIELEYPVSKEERISIGSPAVYRERGGARFIITVAALSDGKAQALSWADELRDLFRSKFFDGIETGEASPAVIDDRNAQGNRYRVPFVVTYTFDYIK